MVEEQEKTAEYAEVDFADPENPVILRLRIMPILNRAADGTLMWVRVYRAAIPSYNTSTETVVKLTNITSAKVTETWTVVPIPDPIQPTPPSRTIPQRIADESARRITAGIIFSTGVQFECSTDNLLRMTIFKDQPTEFFPRTFKTRGGVSITIPSPEIAAAIHNAMTAYIIDVMEAEAVLLDSPPDTPEYDNFWPIVDHDSYRPLV
jgi:hypothetical protein